ncbi:hypothetical protein D3C81_1875870 [compost metagenome]
MEHMPRRQCMPSSSADLAGGAANAGAKFRQLLAFGQQAGAGGTVDGAVHTAAAQQGFVGRVDDGVNGQLGDVALPDFNAHGMIFRRRV